MVGAGPSSKQFLWPLRSSQLMNIGADIVRELGMLCVERSPLAPRRIYRSLRSQPRYDIELDKGWSEHINNVAPIHTVEAPSSTSATGTVITVSAEILNDVDVSPASHIDRFAELNCHRSSCLLPDTCSALSSAVRRILLSTKHPC